MGPLKFVLTKFDCIYINVPQCIPFAPLYSVLCRLVAHMLIDRWYEVCVSYSLNTTRVSTRVRHAVMLSILEVLLVSTIFKFT